MTAAPSPTTANRVRWFHPTPARLLIVLLVVEGNSPSFRAISLVSLQ